MIEQSRFYRAVRQLAVSAPAWSADVVRYFPHPDEEYDLTLISQRVYGNRDEYLTVMAAAGLDRFDQPLPMQGIVLPTKAALERIKKQTGFSSSSPKRVR